MRREWPRGWNNLFFVRSIDISISMKLGIAKKHHSNKEILLHSKRAIQKAWYHLKEDTGCSICTNQNVVKGINDISTTHKQYLKYFKDIEDAYLYSYGSTKEIIVKCPDCGNLRQMKINDLIRKGFSCPKCGDGIS